MTNYVSSGTLNVTHYPLLMSKVKEKVSYSSPLERRRGAHLPFLGHWACRWIYTESVTHGQCNARPTVIFPTIEHHRPLAGSAGTNLYCLVNRGTCVWTTCPESLREVERPELEPVTYWLHVRCPDHYATAPHSIEILCKRQNGLMYISCNLLTMDGCGCVYICSCTVSMMLEQ